MAVCLTFGGLIWLFLSSFNEDSVGLEIRGMPWIFVSLFETCYGH